MCFAWYKILQYSAHEKGKSTTGTYLTEKLAARHARHLHAEKKSDATIEKHSRNIRRFGPWLVGREITKVLIMDYKKHQKQGYALRSINSMLTSVKHFLRFCGQSDCWVWLCRIQQEICQPLERELTKTAYLRLLHTARGERCLWLLQAICETSIRVSELQYFTVSAVRAGEITATYININRKNPLSRKFRKLLLCFAHG